MVSGGDVTRSLRGLRIYGVVNSDIYKSAHRGGSICRRFSFLRITICFAGFREGFFGKYCLPCRYAIDILVISMQTFLFCAERKRKWIGSITSFQRSRKMWSVTWLPNNFFALCNRRYLKYRAAVIELHLETIKIYWIQKKWLLPDGNSWVLGAFDPHWIIANNNELWPEKAWKWKLNWFECRCAIISPCNNDLVAFIATRKPDNSRCWPQSGLFKVRTGCDLINTHVIVFWGFLFGLLSECGLLGSWGGLWLLILDLLQAERNFSITWQFRDNVDANYAIQLQLLPFTIAADRQCHQEQRNFCFYCLSAGNYDTTLTCSGWYWRGWCWGCGAA